MPIPYSYLDSESNFYAESEGRHIGQTKSVCGVADRLFQRGIVRVGRRDGDEQDSKRLECPFSGHKAPGAQQRRRGADNWRSSQRARSDDQDRGPLDPRGLVTSKKDQLDREVSRIARRGRAVQATPADGSTRQGGPPGAERLLTDIGRMPTYTETPAREPWPVERTDVSGVAGWQNTTAA